MPLYTRAGPKALAETREGEAEPLASLGPVVRGETQEPQDRTAQATAPGVEGVEEPTEQVVQGLAVIVLWSGSDNA